MSEIHNIIWENFGGTWSKYYKTDSVVTAKVKYNETFEGVSYENINGWLDYAVADKMVVCSGDFNATSSTRSGVLYVYLDGNLETEVYINLKAKNVIIRDLATLKVTSQSNTVNWQGNSKFRIYVKTLHIQNLQCITSNVDLDATGYYINIPENRTDSTKTYTVTFKGNSTIVPENILTSSCTITLSAMAAESLSITASNPVLDSTGGSILITVNPTNIKLDTISPVSDDPRLTKNSATSWTFKVSTAVTSLALYKILFKGLGKNSGDTKYSNEITITLKAPAATTYILYYGVSSTVPNTLTDMTKHDNVFIPTSINISGGDKCIYCAIPNLLIMTDIQESRSGYLSCIAGFEENGNATGFKNVSNYILYYWVSPVAISSSQSLKFFINTN